MSRQNSFHQNQTIQGPVRSIRSLLKENHPSSYTLLSGNNSFVSYSNKENHHKNVPESYLEEVKNEKIKVYIRIRPLDPTIKTYNSNEINEFIQKTNKKLDEIDEEGVYREKEFNPYFVSEGCCVIFPKTQEVEKEGEDNSLFSSSSVNQVPFVYADPNSNSQIYMKETPDRLYLYSPNSNLTYPINPYLNPKLNQLLDIKKFHFPRVFPSSTSQTSIYQETLQPLILGSSGIMHGYNSSCMVYGQTGSGKTYTMFGNSSRLGLAHLAIRDLLSFNNWKKKREDNFVDEGNYYMDDLSYDIEESVHEFDEFDDLDEKTQAKEKEENKIKSKVNQISLSFFQIYNEQIYDLLDGPEKKCICKIPSYITNFKCKCGALKASQNKSLLPPPLAIREKVDNNISSNSISFSEKDEYSGGAVVVGCQKIVIGSESGAREIISSGLKRRKIRSTNQNMMSSRSHAILQIHVELEINDNKKINSRKTTKNKKNLTSCTLTLIDLAGSEKIPTYITSNSSSTMLLSEKNNQIQRFVESKSINKSILELGNCIQALSARESSWRVKNGYEEEKKKKDFFIPFRNSKLTRLLEEALNGNSKTCIIATIDPSIQSFNESHSTLKFANRAKVIRTVFRKNEVVEKQLENDDEVEIINQEEVEENSIQDGFVNKYPIDFNIEKLHQINESIPIESMGNEFNNTQNSSNNNEDNEFQLENNELEVDDDMELLYYDTEGNPVYVQKFNENNLNSNVDSIANKSFSQNSNRQQINNYLYDVDNENDPYHDVYASQSFLYSFPSSHENYSNGQFVFTLKDFLNTVDDIEDKSKELFKVESQEEIVDTENDDYCRSSPSPQPRSDWIPASDSSPAPLSFSLRSIGAYLDLMQKKDDIVKVEEKSEIVSPEDFSHIVSPSLPYDNNEEGDTVLVGDITPSSIYNEATSDSSSPSTPRRNSLITPTLHSPHPSFWKKEQGNKEFSSLNKKLYLDEDYNNEEIQDTEENDNKTIEEYVDETFESNSTDQEIKINSDIDKESFSTDILEDTHNHLDIQQQIEEDLKKYKDHIETNEVDDNDHDYHEYENDFHDEKQNKNQIINENLDSDFYNQSFEDYQESDLDSNINFNKEDQNSDSSILSSNQYLSDMNKDQVEKKIIELSSKDPHELAIQIIQLQKKVEELESKLH